MPDGLSDFRHVETASDGQVSQTGQGSIPALRNTKVTNKWPTRSIGVRAGFARYIATSASEPDPYLLVLLADQELDSNRSADAVSLIEAAYRAFDQCNFGS